MWKIVMLNKWFTKVIQNFNVNLTNTENKQKTSA